MKRFSTNNHDEEIPKQRQKYNEYNNEDDIHLNDNQDEPPFSKEKEYIQQLLKEKSELDKICHTNSIRLLDQEIDKVQSSGRIPPRDNKYVNIYREKPIKLTTKVLVPVQEHPKFNFVGKLLGPKGNTLKRLQEETMCRMSILGKGSMRDPNKEQELKDSSDPKYAHLLDELHVDISAFGPPAEAYARMAFALAELRKYLIPDKNDSIRQEQLKELESITGSSPYREMHRNSDMVKNSHRVPLHSAPSMMRTATRAPVLTPRVMPAKTKIMSILDRARNALEESYVNEGPSYSHKPRYGGYDSPNSHMDRYEESDYPPQDYYKKSSSMGYSDAPSQRWRSNTGGRPDRSSEDSRYRQSGHLRHPPRGNY